MSPDDAKSALPHTSELIEQGIAARLHLGAQVYVSRGGQPVAHLAIGENRPGEPLTPDHLMLWLSATKPLAAVAIAQLWERGQLALDDRVTRFLPAFERGGKGAITLRHCLTHTSGFRMIDVGWPEEPWDAIVERIAAHRLEPRWVPGERAGYHMQSSWFILGEVVRHVDGRPFERYVRDEIFAPLGLDDCFVGMPADLYPRYRPRLAAMWNTETDPIAPHHWDGERRVTTCAPGSNGYGPARELGRFYEALLAGGAAPEARGGRRILLPQTVEALVARHRVGMIDATFRKEMDWGLGFIPNPTVHGDPDVPYAYGPHASRRAYGHSGYRSSTAFADPEHGLAVVAICNGTPSDERHAERTRALMAAIYEDLGLADRPTV